MAVPKPGFSSSGQTPGNRSPASAAGAQPLGASRPIPLKTSSPHGIPDPEVRDEDDEGDDLREILRNAPAWLISTVFHMLLLILLGLLAVAANSGAEKDVEITSYSEPETDFGSQLDDPSVLEGDSKFLENSDQEQVITPKELPPVDNPLASPLSVGDL